MEGFWWETPGILSVRRQLYVCGVVPLSQILNTLVSRHGTKMESIQRARANWHPIYAYPGRLIEILSTIVASFGTYYMGRRRWLIGSNLIILFGLLLQLSQINSTYDFVGFLLVRSGYDSAMVVGLVYMSEVSDVSLRAFMSGIRNFSLQFAQLLIYLTPRTSHLLNLVPFVSIVISIVISFLVPETPYWLAMNGETEAAEEVLQWLRGNQLDEAEADELLENAAVEAQNKRAGLMANLWSPEFGWRFVIILFMHVSGFVASYMVQIKHFKWDSKTKKYFYTKVGSSNYTFHAWLLRLNQLTGATLFLVLSFLFRRRILFIGTAILSYICILSKYVSSYNLRLAVYWQSLIYLIDNMGLLQISPLISTEIFSTVTRSFGIAVFRLLSMFEFYLDQYANTSPAVDQWYHQVLFHIRLPLIPIGLVSLIFYMPETKNLSLTQAEIAAGSFQVLFESKVLPKSSKY